MAFQEAERARLYLRCALFGPSGSGKTMTALRMAKGIADKMGCRFAVIDTEAGSASKYADRYRFVVDNLSNKTVDGYIGSMREAYLAGYKVLVIDSLSHAWRELTEEVDRIASKSATHNSFQAWGRVSPKQKAFVEAILNFPGHIIATMRSKTEWRIGEGRDGRMSPEKVGLAPEQGKGIEYEFDMLVELNQRHQGIVTKDRTGKFQDAEIDKPGEDFGVALHDWLSEGTAEAPKADETAAASAKTAVKPRKQSAKTKAKTQNPDRTGEADIRAEGDAVIKEIGGIITGKTESGTSYFTEEEKNEARQIIRETRLDAEGVDGLRNFKSFLAEELENRKNKTGPGLTFSKTA
jgi:hypothetical protein